ncbi:MAG TPA: hypothetical protein VFN91_03220 [Myxococcaceae bacterium]|nr:hypothetical protein [Myxococcaceae bacterium]
MTTPSPFLDALAAAGPAPDRQAGLQLYAFLVGSWSLDARYPRPDGSSLRSRGEVHAGWVLEGRAIQDVWAVPARGLPRGQLPVSAEFYGSTLRVYDPGLDAWHILWSDPLRQVYRRQLGRAEGPDIVQLGGDDEGAKIRWSFRDRTQDAFHWRAERSTDGGVTWTLQVEYLARRTAT